MVPVCAADASPCTLTPAATDAARICPGGTARWGRVGRWRGDDIAASCDATRRNLLVDPLVEDDPPKARERFRPPPQPGDPKVLVDP
jgi:hypothetical protein